VKTFGNDAGVYQTTAPLEQGRSYLVSARVKRLSGTLVVEAYPYAWGPAVMRRTDSTSTGWTRLAVGLTPIDGGAHIYLVASPQAEFLIDDVVVTPASVQVGAPEAQPYDFGDTWRYRVRLVSGGTAREALVQAVRDEASGAPLSPPKRVRLPAPAAKPAAQAVTVELEVPLRAEGALTVQVSEATTGEPLGGSPIVPLQGTPWAVRYPYKDGLYSSTGYQWPLRVAVLHVEKARLPQLRGKASITDKAGKQVRAFTSRLSGEALELPLDGRGLPPGEYGLRLIVQQDTGRQLYQEQRSLRILAKRPHEVVFSADGQVLTDGKPFFPIGLYWVLADPAGWKPGPARKLADLQELREAGFNSLHTYAFEHGDANDTDGNALAYLDMAQELGFKVMMGLRREWYQGADLNLEAIEARVRKLRDHPALLCWTLWDEPNFDSATAPRVQAMYDAVSRTDPYHPAMPVFGGSSMRAFRAAADANLFDCYPGSGNAGILPRVFAEAHASAPDKPIWFVAQGHQDRPEPTAAWPSEQDMRLYAQHALEAGAQAIWWYSYGGDWKGWDCVKANPAHWEDVKRVVHELAQKLPR
jgi:hypothetical protein